ncbi:hypothetical protein BA190_27540 [Labrys sp. WJW]|uniref:phage tail length tape measure family protein n=1 Tax=Labrys sp. WJW TaxID=1737983 RepID=UPI00082F9E13|nr:phage tail length tape measure family protein [Labrys sp. WJW]OCC01718.1 hypothetical protein BA190_27540 [Labrys sp. WJW]
MTLQLGVKVAVDAKELVNLGAAGDAAMDRIDASAKKAEQSVNNVANAAQNAAASPAPAPATPPASPQPPVRPTPANNNRPVPTSQGEAAGVSRLQMMMFGSAAQNTLSSLSAGASPMQVLVQQGSEVAQAFTMGTASPLQVLKSLGSTVAGLVSPTVLAVAGLGGLTAALVLAGTTFAGQQKQINDLISRGVGRGSGARLSQINAVADEATIPGFSRSSARDIAAGLAGTGRISGGMISSITGLAPGLASLMGGDLEAAGQRLAQAFADPTKGAEDLEKALGPLDDKTKQAVRSLQAMGDVAGAQRALLEGIRDGVQQAAEQTGIWARIVTNLSNAWDDLGNKVNRTVTGGTLEEQLGDAQMKYIELEKQLSDSRQGTDPNSPLAGILGQLDSGLQKQVQDALVEVNRLQTLVDQARATAAANRKTAEDKAAASQAGEYVRSVQPDIQKLQTLRDMLASMSNAAASPDIMGRMGVSGEQTRQAIDAVTGALQSYMSADEKARASEQLTIAAINARTVAEKANIASQRERLALAGQSVSVAEQQRRAEAAAAAVMAQANRDSVDKLKAANDNAALTGLSDYQRQLASIDQKYRDLLTENQGASPDTLANIQNARSAEISTAQQTAIGGPLRDANRSLQEQVAALKLQQEAFGKSAGEAAKLAAAQEMINRYNAAGVPITDGLRAAIDAYAASAGKVAQASHDLTQKQNQVIASLDQVRDTSRNVLGGLFSDLMHGTSAADALANAAGKIGDQLISNATNNIVDSLLGKNGQIGGGLFGDFLGGLFGKQVGLSTADITAGIVNVNGGFGGDITRLLGGALPTAAANSNVAGAGLAPLKGLGPTASITSSPLPSVGSAVAALAGLTPGGGTFSTVGNYRSGVNAQLTDILRTAAERSGLQVQAISGLRPGDPRFHGQGLATDVSIIDPATGRALPNYQNGAAFRQYESFAQVARQVQMERYPELSDQFRWGGYFSGGKGKYGAADLMHFDLGGRRVGMGGGSWANGLTPAQRALFPDATSIGMGSGQGQLPGLQQLQSSLSQLGTAAQSATPSLSNVISGMSGLPSPLAMVATNANQAGSAIGQGGGGLVGALQSLLSSLFSGMGIGAHADGTSEPIGTGRISGPGTSRSDSILARVSNGEFIVNAAATRRNLPLLQAINTNRLPAFADGGAVASGSPASAGAWRHLNDNAVSGQQPGITMNLYNQAGVEIEQKSSTDAKGRRQLDVYIGKKTADQVKKPGSDTSRAMQAQFGLTRQVTRR